MILYRKFRSAIRRFRNWKEQVYVSKVSRKAPWVFVSYVTDVFYHPEDLVNFHQNRREALAMAEVFNGLGYNVHVQDLFSRRRLPDIKPVTVFGQGTCFERAIAKYGQAKKVYYATGAHYDHQNRQVILLTDMVNRKYGSDIPYRRLVDHQSSYAKADRILMIGSHFTIETFPVELRDRISLIHESTQDFETLSDLSFRAPDEFFFMGSYGNILRGVPLLVEYFSSHRDLVLNVVGPVEEDYYSLIKDGLPPNIRFYGFMDVRSPQMLEIMSRCNFMIYPSGSDSCPGSVLNAMKNGLVPIVTEWAAFDGLERFGYIMKSWDVDSIAEGVEWARSLSRDEVERRMREGKEFVSETFTIDRFKSEFKAFFQK